jgi:hypothetical protein
VIDSFSEAQGFSHVRVQTAEPANWSKEVLDCRPAAGVQITLLNKAAHLLTGEYKEAAARDLGPEVEARLSRRTRAPRQNIRK